MSLIRFQHTTLFTFHAKIVAEDSKCAIGIDRDMEVLVHQKIVAWTLADNPEVVHKGLLETNPANNSEQCFDGVVLNKSKNKKEN